MEANYFKDFFSRSPIAFSCQKAIFDNEGMPYDYEFLFINEAFAKLMNIQCASSVHRKFSEVFQEVGRENLVKKTLEYTNTNLEATHFDLYLDQDSKWIRIHMFPLHEHTFGCTYFDVTKEYMLVQDIEGFLKVNIDLLCVIDLKGHIMKVNKAFERILGYKFEELQGNKITTLIHPEDVQASKQTLKKLKDQKSVSNFINRIRGNDGLYRILEWHSETIGTYIYASARDITETQKLEMQLYKNNESLIELTEKLERKNKILKDLAIKDELTGLYNRHYLDQWIDQELSRADHEQQPLSMIIFDLDHFKRVNDIWGHPVGDEVLKQTAHLANRLIREPEFLVRLGGEEFAILLPGSNLKQAIHIAETIRQTMEDYKYPIVGHLTASFGVAEKKNSEKFYCWYKRTDKAMYRAKEAGRNRVFCSDDEDRPLNAPIKFVWKSEWESGNPKIDEEHRELVEQANSLVSLSLSDIDDDKIIPKVDTILNNIIEHFRDEEEILKNVGYPDYEKHAEIHQCLLDKVFQFKKAYQCGDLKLSELFSFIVNDLIVGHILNSDSDYFPYTKASHKK